MIKLLLLLLSPAEVGRLIASGGTMLLCDVAAGDDGPRWLLLAASQAIKAWRDDPKAPENASDHAISTPRRAEILALCCGLAADLGFMAIRTHALLSPGAT